MPEKTFFADLILPLALPELFTYRVPREMAGSIKKGQRAVVPFGRGNRLYSGIVNEIHERVPQYQPKYIEGLLDDEPVVNDFQFKLWDWIKDYYLCTPGEVMNAALPGALKLASETRVVLNPGYNGRGDELDNNEFLVAEALETQNVLSLNEVSELLQKKNIHPFIKSLIEKGVILIEEELKEKYKPKKESFVRLGPAAAAEEKLQTLFDELEKAPRQLEILMTYIQLAQPFSSQIKSVKKSKLLKKANASSGSLKSLEEKNVLITFKEETGRLKKFSDKTRETKKLNEDQKAALKEVKSAFSENKVVLLHGVTSSGKTEVYIKLIEEAVSCGEQVLYLLPEIAITTQIIERLRVFFGNKVGVYHSRYSDNERVEVWNKVLKNGEKDSKEDYQIIIGARSAMFLPYNNLGLVIVDEEHENTYKQFDPAPRYHARDTSIVLSSFHGADVLLGSATPSVESYFNAKEGKYALVEMKKRFGNVMMPEIFCADVKEEMRKKKMKSHFSSMLVKKIEDVLENKEQIILFQNRRGFSPYLICETCGSVPQCKNCDVSLTYHKKIQLLKCHYCGYSLNIPDLCTHCGSSEVRLKGFGTEKIEEELNLFFPESKVARMDLDTTRAKNAYHRMISDFEDGNIDILVGTQMVTKGLDFDHVALVGILNADNMLNFPDFRAFERSYQLMAQVSGRAGRKKKRGKVIIQTYNPDHTIIEKVIDNDYVGMFKDEIIERRNFHYPPFQRLISLTLKHKKTDVLNRGADELADGLKRQFGKRVLGPEYPSVARVRNYYQKKILIKIERESSLNKAKQLLMKSINRFKARSKSKSVRVVIDVDPL